MAKFESIGALRTITQRCSGSHCCALEVTAPDTPSMVMVVVVAGAGTTSNTGRPCGGGYQRQVSAVNREPTALYPPRPRPSSPERLVPIPPAMTITSC